MSKKEYSLREAAKLLQFAPATLKRKIERGEVKAAASGKGRSKRYTIAAEDMPKEKGARRVAAKTVAAVKRKVRAAKKAFRRAAGRKQTTVTFQSNPFTPDKSLGGAELALRTTFLQWCTEKLLGK